MSIDDVRARINALIPKPDLALELGVSSRTVSRWMEDPDVDGRVLASMTKATALGGKAA